MRKLLCLLVLILIMIQLAACGSGNEAESKAAVNNAAVSNEVDTYGIVKAMDIQDIMIDFPASVEKIHVIKGQRVKSGDVLATMDFKDFESQLGIKDSDIKVQKSQGNRTSAQKDRIKALEKELEVLRGKLNKSYIKQDKIVSDVKNGMITDIGYLPGDVVSSSVKVISIADLDTLYVQANVQEYSIKDVKLNAEAVVTPFTDKSKKYKGKVESISNTTVQYNGEAIVPVVIRLEDGDGSLYLESNVDVKISK